MAKVKICLDTGCTKYILLDDGKTINTPKDKCVEKIWTRKDREDYKTIVRETNETIMVNRPVLQNVKVGDEVNL